MFHYTSFLIELKLILLLLLFFCSHFVIISGVQTGFGVYFWVAFILFTSCRSAALAAGPAERRFYECSASSLLKGVQMCKMQCQTRPAIQAVCVNKTI